MTSQEKIQKHLELAVGSLANWLFKIPNLSPLVIQSKIVESIHREFSNNEIPLHHFEMVQINESEYTVTVNKSAFMEIKIEGKVVNG